MHFCCSFSPLCHSVLFCPLLICFAFFSIPQFSYSSEIWISKRILAPKNVPLFCGILFCALTKYTAALMLLSGRESRAAFLLLPLQLQAAASWNNKCSKHPAEIFLCAPNPSWPSGLRLVTWCQNKGWEPSANIHPLSRSWEQPILSPQQTFTLPSKPL